MTAVQLQLIEVERRCTKCGIVKPHDEFYRRSEPGKILHKQCKACMGAAQAVYRAKPEVRPAKAAYHAAYYETNTELIAARRAAYRGTPRGKAAERAHCAAYYAANAEQIRERQAAYRRTPEARAAKRASDAQRRALKAINCTLTASEWAEILEDDGDACHYCGVAYTADNPPTQDHVVPLSKGGHHTKDNVVSACLSCNCSKGASLDWASDKVEARAVRLGCVDAIEYLTGLARMNVHLEGARGAQGA